MKVVALIPARYTASRFPGKLLQSLGNKTVIRHTTEATQATLLFDQVIVITDSDLIEVEINKFGGVCKRSTRHFESGTDRIAEVAATMDADIIVNVQGDTPFIKKEPLAALLDAFDSPTVEVASLMQPILDHTLIQDPNVVKVVTDLANDALYFSRNPIPYNRDNSHSAAYYEHIGVYAFRKNALLEFTTWPVSSLESTEKLEQLRYLEHGKKIRMVKTNYNSIAIDTPADLVRANIHLASL
ncbi:MAG: 3-deoxy-manno-octulosonate cytidylyltransferase [Bacteroidetes bacterium]|nr:3-deoxy-manno-octulosonate cytidylyltransferase [Bacteroidota bacterium]